MNKSIKISDVKVNDTINFSYDGGTHPGVRRTVMVTEVEPRHICGYDMSIDDESNYRRFSISKMGNLKLVHRPVTTTKTFTFVQVRNELIEFVRSCNSIVLGNLYKQVLRPEATSVVYDGRSGSFDVTIME